MYSARHENFFPYYRHLIIHLMSYRVYVDTQKFEEKMKKNLACYNNLCSVHFSCWPPENTLFEYPTHHYTMCTYVFFIPKEFENKLYINNIDLHFFLNSRMSSDNQCGFYCEHPDGQYYTIGITNRNVKFF